MSSQVFQIADRWEVEPLLAVVAKTLAMLSEEQLTIPLINSALHMPHHLQQLDGCRPFVNRCRQRVLSVFSNAYHTYIHRAQRGAFLHLSFPAVRFWAASSELRVDHENTVVVLLSLWAASEEGQRCSEEQLRELTGLVRMLHVSNGYLLTCVRKLRWMVIGEGQLEALQLFKLSEPWTSETNQRSYRQSCGAPSGWFLPPRQSVTRDASVMVFEVDAEQLVMKLQEAQATGRLTGVDRPAEQYCQGYEWQVHVEFSGYDGQSSSVFAASAMASATAPKQLGLYVYCRKPAATETGLKMMGFNCSVRSKAVSEMRLQAIRADPSSQAYGWPRWVNRQISRPQDLEPLLGSDRKLRITLSIESVT